MFRVAFSTISAGCPYTTSLRDRNFLDIKVLLPTYLHLLYMTIIPIVSRTSRPRTMQTVFKYLTLKSRRCDLDPTTH